MTKKIINIGAAANDRQGDSLRAAFTKVNENFTELYTALGLDSGTLNIAAFEFTGSTITTTDSSAITIDQHLKLTSDLELQGSFIVNDSSGRTPTNTASPAGWIELIVNNSTVWLPYYA
jgi:hypothetical protein